MRPAGDRPDRSGWMLRSGIVHFKDSERVVSVKGLSEKEVKADRVIWPLAYKEVGDNLMTLYNTLETSNAKIVDFLKSNGITDDEITIAPAEIIDMDAERYGPQSVKYRYNVTSVLTVTTDKVDLVVKLMSRQSDLLKQGVAITGGDYRFTTQFLYTSTALNEIKPKMIEEATENARIAGEKFAHDSEKQTGKDQICQPGTVLDLRPGRQYALYKDGARRNVRRLLPERLITGCGGKILRIVYAILNLIFKNTKLMKRRDFLKTFAGMAALTIVPRHVLGGTRYTAPSDQLTKGIIGVGGMGRGHYGYAGTRLGSHLRRGQKIIWRPASNWPAINWPPIPTTGN